MTKYIIPDTSTVAYSECTQGSRRRKASDATSSAGGAPTFTYQVAAPPQQNFICCPVGVPAVQYAPVQCPGHHCYLQPTHAPAQYTYQPQTYLTPGHTGNVYHPVIFERNATVAGAPQTVPLAAAVKAVTESGENEDETSAECTWVGRTRAQVDNDKICLAVREAAFKDDPMMPEDPRPDQLFWVVENNGRVTLRMFKTIHEEFGPGQWARDARHGNAVFYQDKPAEKKKKKK